MRYGDYFLLACRKKMSLAAAQEWAEAEYKKAKQESRTLAPAHVFAISPPASTRR